MIRFYKEIRRGHGKASDMYRLWIGVERIFQGADSEGGLSVSVLSPWDPLVQTARRFLGSRKAAAFFSALAAGWAAYHAIRKWSGRR